MQSLVREKVSAERAKIHAEAKLDEVKTTIERLRKETRVIKAKTASLNAEIGTIRKDHQEAIDECTKLRASRDENKALLEAAMKEKKEAQETNGELLTQLEEVTLPEVPSEVLYLPGSSSSSNNTLPLFTRRPAPPTLETLRPVRPPPSSHSNGGAQEFDSIEVEEGLIQVKSSRPRRLFGFLGKK